MPDIDWKSDLLVGVMNLGEMELHAHFSYLMTNKEEWIDIKNRCRELRTKYMEKIEKEENSQLHCFNKHLMSSAFRLIEVGDKFLSEGKKDESIEYYNDAGELLELFYKLNFGEEPKKSFIQRVIGK